MENNFAIKSKYFSLYQAFREEAEKAGWIHNASFNPFTEETSNYHDCLFFCTHWLCEMPKPMFSFSNSGNNVFNLPEQWNEAIEHMRSVIQLKKEKAKVTISLRQLADQHGVDVDDINITA